MLQIDRRLVIIGGKGGVGRTTICAALALALARQGRRVLLAHVRTRQHVHRMLGCHELDEEIREVLPGLWAVNMNPQAALRERGLMVLRFNAVYRAVMENRLVKYFLRAIPALDEYSMLGKAWYHTTERLEDGSPRFDTVVFDGPATGHLVTMLRIPQVIVETVPEGPLTVDARQVLELLQDPRRTVMWIATLAEEMAVSEAVDLHHRAVTDLHLAVDRVVVNALYPDDFDAPELWAEIERLHAQDRSNMTALLRSARTIHGRREINRGQLKQLQQQIPLPQVRIPHLFQSAVDPAGLLRIAQHLDVVEQQPELLTEGTRS